MESGQNGTFFQHINRNLTPFQTEALSAIRRGMPEPEQPRFNLKLTPELKAELARARRSSGRSMNGEILARLSLTFRPDLAMRLADAARPLLAEMSEADSNQAVEMIAGILQLAAKNKARKRR